MKRVRCPKCDNFITFDEKKYTEGQSLVFQCGYITVIENVFHYKQVIPLHMGVNVIGRYMKNSGVNCAIETNDPSIDINHCSITVSRDKKGNLKYVLKDGPSYTGTFVDNVILGDREQRVIEDGTLFTIVILHTDNINDTTQE
mgnify:CR=1 FL=1